MEQFSTRDAAGIVLIGCFSPQWGGAPTLWAYLAKANLALSITDLPQIATLLSRVWTPLFMKIAGRGEFVEIDVFCHDVEYCTNRSIIRDRGRLAVQTKLWEGRAKWAGQGFAEYSMISHWNNHIFTNCGVGIVFWEIRGTYYCSWSYST